MEQLQMLSDALQVPVEEFFGRNKVIQTVQPVKEPEKQIYFNLSEQQFQYIVILLLCIASLVSFSVGLIPSIINLIFCFKTKQKWWLIALALLLCSYEIFGIVGFFYPEIVPTRIGVIDLN